MAKTGSLERYGSGPIVGCPVDTFGNKTHKPRKLACTNYLSVGSAIPHSAVQILLPGHRQKSHESPASSPFQTMFTPHPSTQQPKTSTPRPPSCRCVKSRNHIHHAVQAAVYSLGDSYDRN